MHLKMKWNKVLNPDQTPADVSDQPICALTKESSIRIFYSVFTHVRQLCIE